MRNCFIPGCDKLCRMNGTVKRKMFVVPKDKETFKAWWNVLPKKRELKAHDKVCERHFQEEDISTTYDNIVNGQLYKMERGRAKLKPKAIPSRNFNYGEGKRRYKKRVPVNKRKEITEKIVPEDIHIHPSTPLEEQQLEVVKEVQDTTEARSRNFNCAEGKKLYKTRVLLNKRNKIIEEIVPEDIRVQPSTPLEEQQLEVDGEVQDTTEACLKEVPLVEETTVCYEGEVPTEDNRIDVDETQAQELFDNLYDDIYEVVLPNTLWGVHRCPERSSMFFSFVDPSMLRTTKMVSISCQGEVKILLGSRLTNEQTLVEDIASIESLTAMIAEVDEVMLCSKMFENEFCEVSLKNTESEVCEACAQARLL